MERIALASLTALWWNQLVTEGLAIWLIMEGTDRFILQIYAYTVLSHMALENLMK